MTAPVPPWFVPDEIEPKDPPNFCDPALLTSVRNFSETVALDEAIAVYLAYENGLLARAFVLYAGYCRSSDDWRSSWKKEHQLWQANYDGRRLGEIILDNHRCLDDATKRLLLQALIILYSHDRVPLWFSFNSVRISPGRQLKDDIDIVANWRTPGGGHPRLLYDWFHQCCNEIGLAHGLCLDLAPGISLFRLKLTGPSSSVLLRMATPSVATATPVPDDDESLDQSADSGAKQTDASAEARRLHQILQNLQYLQLTKTHPASRRPALLQEVHDMRMKYEDHYEELLTQLCAAASATLQAWSSIEDSTLLPSVAEAELWALATKKHCAGLDGHRAATQAGLALMRRATEVCCREGGAVKRRRAHGAELDAAQFDWSLLKFGEEDLGAGRPLMKAIAPSNMICGRRELPFDSKDVCI